MRFPFDNTYAQLPGQFFAELEPTPVGTPNLVKVNDALAATLGVELGDAPEAAAAVFAGNAVPDGASPLAMAYAGHQFGGWVPQLGDGRAILLGEVVGTDGVRYDIQLKGSGRTPFSRNGDGRAWLGPVLREYVVSEAMHAMGVPTTRALAAVTTGEPVFRETTLPGAVLTRVARGHVRVGTFQYFAARQDTASLKVLADHVMARHYPAALDAENPALALLDAVLGRQAGLIAQWLSVGFIHGVMNTDNMSVSGETIDYGPCAFMDTYHPDTVFSSIDHQGRYAYMRQPEIGHWNLSWLASSLLPLIDDDEDAAVEAASAVIGRFPTRFGQAWSARFRAKIGLGDVVQQGDNDLVLDLLQAMADQKADFTLMFRRLCDLGETPDAAADGPVRALFADPSGFDGWLVKWRARLAQEGRRHVDRQAAMRAVNPAYIPRNHRIEAMINAAVDGDFQPFEDLMAVLARPFDEQPEHAAYQTPPAPTEIVRETFCGT